MSTAARMYFTGDADRWSWEYENNMRNVGLYSSTLYPQCLVTITSKSEHTHRRRAVVPYWAAIARLYGAEPREIAALARCVDLHDAVTTLYRLSCDGDGYRTADHQCWLLISDYIKGIGLRP